MSRKTVDVIPLRSEGDWAGLKDRYDALYVRFGCCPFMDFEYLHLNWTSFYPETTCWYLEFRGGQGETVAAGIYREFVHVESPLKPKALRSIDHTMFMAIDPFMHDRTKAASAFDTVAGLLSDVQKATGADMFSLFRMSDVAAGSLADALVRCGLYVRREDCLSSASMDLSIDPEAFYIAKKRQVRDTRRLERKTIEAFPDGVGFQDIKTWELTDSAFEEVLHRLDVLEQKTWQNSWERGSERVDVELTASFNHAAMHQWRQSRLLNLYIQTLYGKDVSFFMILDRCPTIWALKMGFDPEYADYGVGKQVFLHTISQKLQCCSGAAMELGGGANEWKLRWSPDLFNLQKIEWALPSLKGRAWQIFQRARAVIKKLKPARSAGVSEAAAPSSKPAGDSTATDTAATD
jgi:hypothetical protein